MKSNYPLPPLPPGWSTLSEELKKPYFRALREFLDRDARKHTIFPPADSVFRALELTPLRSVRVLILGQDPYHGAGQAHGLAFSVQPGVKIPASLRNMYKELQSDVGIASPSHGSLEAWAKRGVLLLNAVMTVREGEPNSHQGKGWETFTDAVISSVNARKQRVVFVLWGAYAGRKLALIDSDRHTVITTAHPSPLSARRGFFGSRPFSAINAALVEAGKKPIDWKLPTEA
jgi:uracil-DNA glycosylase